MDGRCLDSPTDDQTLDKIRMETDAIIGILFKCFYVQWKLIGSDIIEYEIMKTLDLNKLYKALNIIFRETSIIQKLGTEALNEKLDSVGMVEFMWQFDSGYGEYTKERHEWLDGLAIEDIRNEIKV
jgi:hypothetical protein